VTDTIVLLAVVALAIAALSYSCLQYFDLLLTGCYSRFPLVILAIRALAHGWITASASLKTLTVELTALATLAETHRSGLLL